MMSGGGLGLPAPQLQLVRGFLGSSATTRGFPGSCVQLWLHLHVAKGGQDCCFKMGGRGLPGWLARSCRSVLAWRASQAASPGAPEHRSASDACCWCWLGPKVTAQAAGAADADS